MLVAVGALLGALGSDGFASAQDSGGTTNSLQSIDPPNGATLDSSPQTITLSFNQEIGNTESVFVVVTCNLEVQSTGEPRVDIEGLIVTVDVLSPLPKGACSLRWALRDADGNELVSDSSTFSILNEPAATTTTVAGGSTADSGFDTVEATPTQVTNDEPAEVAGSTEGALWLGRMLSTMAILVVFGSLALISVGWPEGPEYIVTVRFLRMTWIIGLVGTVLYLVAFAAQQSGGAFGDGLSPSAWLDLANAGWPGRAALFRLVVVIAMGWVVVRPERIIDPVTAMWAWGIPGLGLIAVAMSRSNGPAPLLGFVIGIVHVFAAAIWIGGAALVARVVLAGPGEDDLVQAVKAFAKISVPAMLFATITGVAQMVRLDGGELFSSSHGRVVILKAIAVAAMLAVALAARQQVALRLDRAPELTVGLADRFRRAFTAEAAIGIVVLMFSGWLVSLEPAKVDPLENESYPIAMTFTDAPSGIEARVLLGPSRVGRNGLLVDVKSPAEGISAMSVRLIPPLESAPCDLATETGGCEVVQPIPLNGAGVAVRLTEDGLPLGVAGTWTLEFSAATQQGVMQATNTFLVAAADGSIVTSPTTAAPLPTSPVSISVIDSTPATAPLATSPTTTTTTTTVP